MEQQDNYKKSGFKLAYSNVRYQGVGGGSPKNNSDTIALSELPFNMIENYEQALFPAKRSAFSKYWINQNHSLALAVIQNGQLAGYGVIRKCHSGYKIGPLYADSSALAEALFLNLKADISSSEPIYLDIPKGNTAALALVEKYNMKAVFSTARMYTKAEPNISLSRIFGVTSFEIG